MPLHEKIFWTMFICGGLLAIIGWIIYKITNNNERVLDIVITLYFSMIAIPTLYAFGKLLYVVFAYIWA